MSDAPTRRKPDVFEGHDPAVRERTKKMLMYFIVFAVVMLFAGFTSAYIVSNMGQYWVHVPATAPFWVSNALLVLSSITLWLSVRWMRTGDKTKTLVALGLTLALGIGFTVSQAEGWRGLAQFGMGWTVSEHESGMNAYRWNSIEAIMESGAVYGTDYEVYRNGQPILYSAERNEFYAANDELMVKPITRDVARTSNSGGGYLWALIAVHILHLTFGFIYLVVNGIRVAVGTIHGGDVVRLESLSIYWHFMGALWLYLFAFLFFLN
ncbi:MAG: cytochrome c oxidase subunit 3 [Flavobacteriales bacterium]|jgi:heme/copper-type cytochrome/quinol oxidase subunit 3